MDNNLLLLSGNNIPFIGARASVHNPTIKEISFIGEESFHIGIRFLDFSKDILSVEDKTHLVDKSDFEVFMTVVNMKEQLDKKRNVENVLTLLFPSYKVDIQQSTILLHKEDGFININNLNYEEFKDIIEEMFCLKESTKEGEGYNPADKFAQKIADKLKKGRDRVNASKGIKPKKISLYDKQISILAVGLQKDMNELLNYTVYQLQDEFKRYQMKLAFDINMQAKLAGAKDLEEVDNWMDDLHS